MCFCSVPAEKAVGAEQADGTSPRWGTTPFLGWWITVGRAGNQAQCE